MGWTKVHKQILKLPFCEFMQQIVPTVVDPYPYHPSFEGCCYPCFIKEGRLVHKVTMNPTIELIDWGNDEYKGFIHGYDICDGFCHECHNFRNECERLGCEKCVDEEDGTFEDVDEDEDEDEDDEGPTSAAALTAAAA